MSRGNGFDADLNISNGSTTSQAFVFAKQVVRAGGVTGLISLLLSGLVAYMLLTSVRDMSKSIADAQIKMGAFAASQERFDNSREKQLEKELELLRQVCANSAPTGSVAQQACWK